MFSEHDKLVDAPAETSAPATQPATEPEEPPVSSPEASAVTSETPAPDTPAGQESANGAHGAEPSDGPEPGEATETAEAASTTAEAAEAGEAPEQLNEMMEQLAGPQRAGGEGALLQGRVVAITDLGVMVDIGSKSEGLIPAQEFLESEDVIKLESGQSIEVQVTGEEKEGYILLSYQRARRRRAWENIEKSYRHHTNLAGRVVDRIKGGLVVDVGVRAFLPASQVDLRPVHDLETWQGQEIQVRVLKVNRKRGNVVVSRRVILDEEQQAQRQQLMDSLAEGQVLKGTVKNITGYGVFVDLGGLDGLLHITDLSWGRLSHPSEAVKQGEEIEVQVLKFDREKMRVSLGRKQLLPDPWLTVPERYPVAARATGKVVGITDYGAFVELEPGVEGLVHISEMTWSKRMKHPSKVVSLSQEVEVVVLDVRPEQRRISLGLKQTQPDPWLALAQKYPVGGEVSGRVRNLTEFGAFVEIEEGFDGLIHVSDISWTARVRNPSEVFKKGDIVRAKVLKIDVVNRRVSLGVKQLNDIWANWFAAHKSGELVRGKVSRLTSFGAFVELAEGIEGLCHISEIEDRRGKTEKQAPRAAGAGPLEPGKEYDFKIVKLQPEQHKIGLSYRAAVKQAERRDMEDYRSSKSSATATIGDAILAKRETL